MQWVRRDGPEEWRHVVGVVTGRSYGAWRRGVALEVDPEDAAADPDLCVLDGPPQTPRRPYRRRRSRTAATRAGVGTRLHRWFRAMGIRACQSCSATARRMDRYGARWCFRRAWPISREIAANASAQASNPWKSRVYQTTAIRAILACVVLAASAIELSQSKSLKG